MPRPLPELILALRTGWSLTQQDFAAEMRLTVKTISNYELGLQAPGPVALKRLIGIAEGDLALELAEYLPEELRREEKGLIINMRLVDEVGRVAAIRKERAIDTLNGALSVGLAILKGRLGLPLRDEEWTKIERLARATGRPVESICVALLRSALMVRNPLPSPTKPDYKKDVEVIDGRVKRKRGIAQKKPDRTAGGRP